MNRTFAFGLLSQPINGDIYATDLLCENGDIDFGTFNKYSCIEDMQEEIEKQDPSIPKIEVIFEVKIETATEI